MSMDHHERAPRAGAGSLGLREPHHRAALAAAAAIALSYAAGCHKPSAPSEGDAAPSSGPQAAAVGDAGDASAGATADVPPVPPLVPADPGIPVHEAVVGAAPIPADEAAPVASPPPAAPIEDPPPQPEADESWIPGYWWWSPPLGHYVWVSGAWRRPPPGDDWTPGAWSLTDGRYAWAPGYWAPHGYARVMIDLAPPPLRVEVRGPSPGLGFAWTPGYYGFHDGAYAWIGGGWLRPPSVGLGWIEPRYVGIGGRFYLQPGRWDFPPERRGIVYGPDIHVRGGERVRFAPLAPGVVSAHARFVAESAHAAAMGERRPGWDYGPQPGEKREERRDLRPGGEMHGAGEGHGGFEHREGPERREPERREPERREPERREAAPRVEHAGGPERGHGPAPERAPERRRH